VAEAIRLPAGPTRRVQVQPNELRQPGGLPLVVADTATGERWRGSAVEIEGPSRLLSATGEPGSAWLETESAIVVRA
jgi:hypothetical protein